MNKNYLTWEKCYDIRKGLLFKDSSVSRGRFLHVHNMAEIMKLKKNYAYILVREWQQQKFPVHIYTGKDSVRVVCSCPAQDKYLCEHKIAASYTLEEYLYKNPLSFWQDALSNVIEVIGKKNKKTSKKKQTIVFSIKSKAGAIEAEAYLTEFFEFSKDSLGNCLKMAEEIHEHINSNQPSPIRQWKKSLVECGAEPESIAAVKIILSSNGSFYYAKGDVESLILLLTKCPVFRGVRGDPFKFPLKILNEEPAIELDTRLNLKDILISLNATVDGNQIPLKRSLIATTGEYPMWVLYRDLMFPIKKSIEFFDKFFEIEEIAVPEEETEEFLKDYLIPIAGEVNIQGKFKPSIEINEKPIKKLYLFEEEGELRAELRFEYGGYEFKHSSDTPEYSIRHNYDTNQLIKIFRDTELEEEIKNKLPSYGFKRLPKTHLLGLKKSIAPIDFLFYYVPKLQEDGFDIYGEESLSLAKVNRVSPTVSFNIKSRIDWFDIKTIVNFGELQVSLKDIKKALKKHKKYIKLADGSVGLLTDDWVNQYQHLFFLGEETKDGIRMSRHHLTFLDQLVERAQEIEVDDEFEQRREQLKNFTSIKEKEIPKGFKGELRHYQEAGFNWLHFLHKYNFGGCLADDMGTGKTIQTLSFLQSLRESGHSTKPDLIVMPRTLIFNWEREAAKFTPDLKILVHSGQARYNALDKFDEYDLVLTTYGLLRQDINHLKDYRFHYVVMDESQAIKNPHSKTAKSARILNCEHRLVLTGTPVENNTIELWSQFSFLNPGLLGSLNYFRERFVTPIEKRNDPDTADLLRKIIFPFILRRTKEQVESELPPRSERIFYCDMDPSQEKLYKKKRDYYRALLLGLIDEKGINNARMKMLEGLLRLRQICNHPKLVEPDFKGGSAKFEQLFELLETLKSEGHKALVFSQFTKMLELIREHLDKNNIPYVYLDGKTRNREEKVDQFQEDPKIPIFLISLKAGGVGLNLTAASYVIHIDPWWNPAVEMQASDRAHRIGQDKPVFVYKMIVRDSVEEKIVMLQEKKKLLADQLIQTESGFFKSLTGNDIEVLFS